MTLTGRCWEEPKWSTDARRKSGWENKALLRLRDNWMSLLTCVESNPGTLSVKMLSCFVWCDKRDRRCYGFGKIILGHPGRPTVITEVLPRQEGVQRLEGHKEGTQRCDCTLEVQNGKEAHSNEPPEGAQASWCLDFSSLQNRKSIHLLVFNLSIGIFLW